MENIKLVDTTLSKFKKARQKCQTHVLYEYSIKI